MSRIRINLNREWLFNRGDQSETAWQPVGLPHSFDLPYFRTPEFYVGRGFYKREFEVPKEWLGKRLSLEFDGAFQVTDAKVNGHSVGRHWGGYTGFSFDITFAIVAGGNTLEVQVDNTWNARVAPRAGEHIFCGGLYRDVHLVVTEPLHVAWCGVSVSTLAVDRNAAVAAVKTEIVNRRAAVQRCRLVTRLLDAGGRFVAEAAEEHSLSAGS